MSRSPLGLGALGAALLLPRPAAAADGLLARWLAGEAWAAPLDTTLHRFGPWLQAGLILLIGGWLARRARGLVALTLQRSRVDPVLRPALADAVVPLLQLGALFAALARLGLLTDGVLTLLGLLLLALALSLRDTLGQAAAGALLLSQRPFNLGDEITAAGVRGEVDAIGLWSTRLRAANGALSHVPNRALMAAPLHNHSRSGLQRSRLRLPPLPPGDAEAEAALRARLAGALALPSPPALWLVEINEQGDHFELELDASTSELPRLRDLALRAARAPAG
ncbi:MAG: mechanosensitive ion channel family protein [Deltaproteobacteria bacterium]|nr:mechanosensitive ion channel family protein [Deltaproteobacteria bacterium]